MATVDPIDQETELESWRRVHRTLLEAVRVAEDALAAQKAQRRYWLEEICGNLDESGGQQQSSIWKRPVALKKQPAKRGSTKATTSNKRKKVPSSGPAEGKPAKKQRKKKSLEGVGKTTGKPGKGSANREASVSPTGENRTSPGVSETGETAEHQILAPDYGTEPPAYPPGATGPPQWPPGGTTAGAQNLQMMAAVAFGANPASYPMMHHAPQAYPYFPPSAHSQQPQPPIVNASAPQVGHYRPRPHGGSRTYASLEDVGNSDDDDSDHNF